MDRERKRVKVPWCYREMRTVGWVLLADRGIRPAIQGYQMSSYASAVLDMVNAGLAGYDTKRRCLAREFPMAAVGNNGVLSVGHGHLGV